MSSPVLSRRAFLLSSVAVSALVGTDVLVGCGVKSRLLWQEDFKTLDLASPTNPHGRWRPNDVWQPLDKGYADFATGQHSTWLVNPAEQIPGINFNPFSVSNSVLSISTARTPPEAVGLVNGCPWLGGLLVSNTDVPSNVFGYGYYEFRVRLPVSGKGMFPALWLFAARGKNPQAQSEAEIDLFEVFGSAAGTPWRSTLHQGGVQTDIQTQSLDTQGWHTYGVHWTADRMDFYRDDHRLASANKDVVRSFAGAKMSIRLDFVMDALFFRPEDKSDASTPDNMSLQIDYIRQYNKP